MRRSGFFRRYYLLTGFIVLIFIYIGMVGSRLAMRLAAPPNPMESRHFTLYAKLLDHLSAREGESRKAALAEITEWDLAGGGFHFALVDQNGAVLEPADSVLPFDWKTAPKPASPYEYVQIGDRARRSDLHGLIRLSGEPAMYLYAYVERPETPAHRNNPFAWMFGSLAVSVLLGVALALMFLFRSLREKARLADEVLAQMQQGNLKARFPIKRMDEIGQAMSRFNRMADEIERLVEQVQDAEKSRMKLLQELAHDLRTPVASQKTLLETLISKGDEVVPSLRKELLSLVLAETEYFARLIEDLLVLAQVSEPRYRIESERIEIAGLVRDEADSIAALAHGKKVRIHDESSGSPLVVDGDSHLLRRMFRNALTNAVSFARAQVSITLRIEGENALIAIEDDGEGFSTEALSSFGVRRVTRALAGERNGKLSVGLGSVILRSVAEIHGGSVVARNRKLGESISGASVEIILPLVSTGVALLP